MGGAEHAALALELGEHGLAGVGHVLAEDPDALVGRHGLVQRAVDGLAEGDGLAVAGVVDGLEAVGSATTWSSTVAGSGGRRPAPPWRPRPPVSGGLGDPLDVLGREHAGVDERLGHPAQRVVRRLVGQLVGRAVLATACRPTECEYGRVTSAWSSAGPDAGAHVGDGLAPRLAHLQ